jgi:hypothetical protein
MVPKYQPEQWVIFSVNAMLYLGKITNAVYGEFDGKTEWRYNVTMASGSTQSTPESDITHYFAGNTYITVGEDS